MNELIVVVDGACGLTEAVEGGEAALWNVQHLCISEFMAKYSLAMICPQPLNLNVITLF